MINHENPVAPWEDPKFKAKLEDTKENVAKRKEIEKRLDELTKKAAEYRAKEPFGPQITISGFNITTGSITIDEPSIDWDGLRTSRKPISGKDKPIPTYETHVMDGVNVLTHPIERCKGRNCVIHNPSDHHMRDWPKRFHQPSQQTARVCKHGVGHPDPDDVAYWREIEHRRINTSHDCDGCCTPKK